MWQEIKEIIYVIVRVKNEIMHYVIAYTSFIFECKKKKDNWIFLVDDFQV